MNVRVIAGPKGRLRWVSPALAGAVHDVRAAREHGIIDAFTEAGITCWADKGCQGAGGRVRLPHRGRWDNLSAGQQAVNAKIRALVEQAIATLKSWRLPRNLRCSTTRITSLAQAVLTLRLAIELGVHPEALRGWIRQAEADTDAGERDDRLTTDERAELAALRKENVQLKRANEVLRTASALFTAQLDPTRPR